jgi:Fe-S cluster biogenesis protein NfuA
MFIQTENTPNPATLKFIPGEIVSSKKTYEFVSIDEAGKSPLAQLIFAIENVTGVFLGSDFISVTIEGDWQEAKPQILGAIMQHYSSDQAVVIEDGNEVADGVEEDENIIQIKAILEEKVRPAVAQDGGDVLFERFEDGVVFLKLQGACAGCPSSTMTLKHGIENLLKYYVPDVQEVRQVI